MPYLSESPRLRLTTLCLLYVSQGIPYGFLHTALKPHLVTNGVSVQEMATLIVFATLPWTFKFVWGPLIDSFGFRSMGKRRPWIIFAQGGMAISLVSMSVLGEPHLHLTALGWMLFVHNLFSSLQDVSVDALAVDMLTEKERGRANGMMYGSSVAGNSISGVTVGYVLGSYGFTTALAAQFVVLFFIFLVPLSVRERPGEKRFPWSKGSESDATKGAVQQSIGAVFRNLLRAFSLRSTVFALLLAIGSMIAYDAFATAEDNFFINHLNWSEEAMRNWKSTFLWVTVGGCLAGGFLSDLFGPKKLITISAVLLGSLLAGFGLVPFWWETPGFAVTVLGLGALLVGLLNVSLFTLFMKVSWPVVAATQFTAFMAMMNLSKTTGAAIAGPLEEHFSWPHFFIAVGCIQIAVLVLLIPIDPGETRRKLGHGTVPDPNAGPGSSY